MIKASLLLAEDNLDMAGFLQRLLEQENYLVSTAADGAMALQRLEQVQPDAILTDIMMPGVDGIALIRHIRNSKELADLPIVAMTAYDDHFVDAAITAGATAVLRKPEDLDRLVDTLNQVIALGASGH